MLPAGRIPTVGMREIVAALHRRRQRRRAAVSEITAAITQLKASIQKHLERIAALKTAVEAQGGDASHLQHYDNLMARLRAELHSAEQSLAAVFGEAAREGG